MGRWGGTDSVSDADGNAAESVSRTVSVVDTTAPVITLLGDAVVSVEAKGSYSDLGATASDTLDGSLSVSSVSTVNTDAVGSYSVTYSVSDANGNAAESVTRTVSVVDTTAPVITLLGDAVVIVEAKGSHGEWGASPSAPIHALTSQTTASAATS